jgi:2-ketocyclohexanecarboxyl-CoA hydrolase
VRGIVGPPIDEFQSIIRDVPKPVIARVNGFAIGGGNVFATLRDLTIAADTAKFGQVGPKVGSVDAGWGAALLARHIGDKRAREMWYLNEMYSAQQAYEMGLVNKVVPAAEFDAAVKAWTDILAERSPTALALAKRSFNADSENIRGISLGSLSAVKLFYDPEESREGARVQGEAQAGLPQTCEVSERSPRCPPAASIPTTSPRCCRRVGGPWSSPAPRSPGFSPTPSRAPAKRWGR